ncbi:MAG: hypothetical protein JW818_07225 [Pirellulales bacterium]|nr:hypothetical protein [Pirellulales bacterium]
MAIEQQLRVLNTTLEIPRPPVVVRIPPRDPEWPKLRSQKSNKVIPKLNTDPKKSQKIEDRTFIESTKLVA